MMMGDSMISASGKDNPSIRRQIDFRIRQTGDHRTEHWDLRLPLTANWWLDGHQVRIMTGSVTLPIIEDVLVVVCIV